jgi:3-hydroxyacyl-[acyl-carrier-protein] dehydratase
METGEVLSRLPHRHPYLLIDRVTTLEPGKRVVAVKAVSYTEYCLSGHFPGDPIYPGAFMIEAASQAAGLLRQNEDNIAGNLVEVLRFQFKKPVRPGHLIVIEALQNNAKGPFLLADVTLTVEDTLVACGSLQLYTPKNS